MKLSSDLCPECESNNVVLTESYSDDSSMALLCKACGYSGSAVPEREMDEASILRAVSPKKAAKVTRRKSKR